MKLKQSIAVSAICAIAGCGFVKVNGKPVGSSPFGSKAPVASGGTSGGASKDGDSNDQDTDVAQNLPTVEDSKRDFQAAIDKAAESARKACKMQDLKVTSDFENIDMNAWGGGGRGKRVPPSKIARYIASECVFRTGGDPRAM